MSRKHVERELQQIVEQAKRTREEAHALRGPEPVQASQRRTPKRGERFSVYASLFPLVLHPFWLWLAVFGALLILACLAGNQMLCASKPVFIGMMTVGLGRYFLAYAYWLSQYPLFSHWRQQLGFRLVGWPRLVDSIHFTNPDYWRLHCKISIHFRSDYSIHNEKAEAILFMFCSEANHCYYLPRDIRFAFDREPRLEWRVVGNTLQGSSNREVVKQIYKLCQNLSLLTKNDQAVESVLIEVDETEIEILPFDQSHKQAGWF